MWVRRAPGKRRGEQHKWVGGMEEFIIAITSPNIAGWHEIYREAGYLVTGMFLWIFLYGKFNFPRFSMRYRGTRYHLI